MSPGSTPRATHRKSSFYPDDVLDRVIEASGGLPDDDREVEVLCDIDVDGQRVYERAPRRDALRICLEGGAEQFMRSLRDALRRHPLCWSDATPK